MTKIKYFNIAPYYDDFDKEKNYMQVLFRPSFSVQSRELNQLQTSLRAQIDRFGSHIFKDGSPVVGGNVHFDKEFDYVKIESSFTSANTLTYNTANFVSELVGQVITGVTSGVTATVIAYTVAEGTDPLTLFVKYKSAGTNNTSHKFLALEELTTTVNSIVRRAKVRQSSQTPIGVGSRISVDEGYWFISGNFVHASSESLILDKYSNNVSYRIGYKITESVVTAADDNSIYSNATGSPNFNAPGANRYAIKLDLIKEPISFDERSVDEYIQLILIQNGEVSQKARTEYSELAETLAQRTYEESGNYVLQPFSIHIKEHLNNGSNQGEYTEAQGGDITKMAIGLEKSVAFVNGFRYEIEDTKYVPIDKARDIESFNAGIIGAQLGNYFLVTTVVSLPDIDDYSILNLKDVSNVTIGTARVRSFSHFSGTYNGSGQYKLYVFDLKMNANKTRSQIVSVQQTLTNGGANFSAVLVDSVLRDPANNSLVFKLPFNNIKTLRSIANEIDTLYEVKKTFTGTVSSLGKVTLTSGSNAFFTDTNPSDWQAVRNDTGAMVNISSALTIGGSPFGSSIEINFGVPLNGVSVNIVGKLRKQISEKTKTKLFDQQVNITSPNTTPGNFDSLRIHDVTKISAIYMSSGMGTNATTSSTNVTSRYVLDNGQRDNYYDVSRIQLLNGQPAPSGRLLVVCDYYSHQSGGDYFSVDSYVNTDYQDIPKFSGSKGVIELRDAIDFRPTIDYDGVDFTTSGSVSVDSIVPNSIITADFQYYLNRIDKVYIGKDGKFGVIKGISSIDPSPPENPKDGMVLYELYIGAYTYSKENVIPRLVDNRRFTMRDISDIERRVSKLEYYTSLALLEKETADLQIFDSENMARYKNGFIVDGFYGHNVGDTGHLDYSVSMDTKQGLLRPSFTEGNVRMIYNSSKSTGVRKTGPLITLPYTEVSFIEQPYASSVKNVNPYGVFSYDGTIDLSPDSDEWKETETRPDVVIDQNGINDALKNIIDETGATGTKWDEWRTNHFGITVQQESGRESLAGTWWSNWNRPFERTITTSETSQTRRGIQRTVATDTITQTLGDRIVEVNVIPHIRSREIFFRGSKFKPNTRVYPFLDNKDISDYCREKTFVEFSSNPDNIQNYRNFTSHPEGSTALITDNNGNISGSFIVPNNNSIRFRTGSRVFRLTDSADNGTVGVNTSGEVIYEARGLRETKENVVISTKVPRIERRELSESRVLVATDIQTRWIDPIAQSFICDIDGGIFATSIDLYFKTKDTSIPVTLQIRIMENGYPTQRIVPYSEITLNPGSVNISNNASVATKFTFPSLVHLQRGVEYCFVIISNSNKYECWTSVIGGFDVTNPNFRITTQPYVGSYFDSQNSSTFSADQTRDIKFKINRASFSTNVGNLYLKNAAVPAKKLTNDCLYFTSGQNEIRVYHKDHGMFENSKVLISGVVATSGSTVNNIPLTEINKLHTISEVEFDWYVITATTNANVTGRAGGSGIYASENKLMNVVYPVVNSTEIQNTAISWRMKLSSGQSLASVGEQPYNQTGWISVSPNDNYYLNNVHCVPSVQNEVFLSNPSDPSCEINGIFSTDKDNLSPVVDLERCSITTISNRIDNPSSTNLDGFNTVKNFVSGVKGVGSSNLANYVTKKFELNDEADSIKILINANRPKDSYIEMYYKVGDSNDTNFESENWVLVNPDNGSIPFSDDFTSYTEIEYTIDETELNQEYTSIAYKIQLKSSNSSNIPTIKDFRGISTI